MRFQNHTGVPQPKSPFHNSYRLAQTKISGTVQCGESQTKQHALESRRPSPVTSLHDQQR